MLPPTAASRTSGTSWAEPSRKYPRKCFHRRFRFQSSHKSNPLVSSVTGSYHPIIVQLPLPPSTTLLPRTCLTSYRGTSPPGPRNHLQLVSGLSPPHTQAPLLSDSGRSATQVKFIRQTVPAPEKGSPSDNPYRLSLFSQVIFHLNSRLFWRLTHTITNRQISGKGGGKCPY